MFKKFIALFLTLSLVIPGFTAVAEESRLKAFDEIWLKDISGYDLRDKGDILTTTTFNSDQKWPSADKMDEYERVIVMTDGTAIPIDEIISIDGQIFETICDG